MHGTIWDNCRVMKRKQKEEQPLSPVSYQCSSEDKLGAVSRNQLRSNMAAQETRKLHRGLSCDPTGTPDWPSGLHAETLHIPSHTGRDNSNIVFGL